MKDVINEHTKIAVLFGKDVTNSRTENVRHTLEKNMQPSAIANFQRKALTCVVSAYMRTCLPILEMITIVQPTTKAQELIVARKAIPNGMMPVSVIITALIDAWITLLLTFVQKLGSRRP